MAAETPQRYRCTAPLIMIPADGPGGLVRMLSVIEGAILSADVDPDRIAHLVRHGLIEPVSEAG